MSEDVGVRNVDWWSLGYKHLVEMSAHLVEERSKLNSKNFQRKKKYETCREFFYHHMFAPLLTVGGRKGTAV